MSHLLSRLKLECTDRLRYSRFAWSLKGLTRWAQAQVAGDLDRRLELLGDAYRILLPTGHAGLAESPLRKYLENPSQASLWRDHKIGWNPRDPQFKETSVSKGLVLKPWVSPREKGVIFVSFEYNLYPLLNLADLKGLAQRYTIICAPSWSPPSFHLIWSLAHLPGADIFFTISNRADEDWLVRLKTGARVLPLLVSHWVIPQYFQPKPRSERSIDILMVANWGSFKRHWVLFKALREMRHDLRVVLVGQPDSGRTLEHVLREADYYGVRERVDFRNRLSIEEVNRLQCDSKINLVFSRREGSCVVVAESLFADTPVGLLQEAHIGSSAFINAQTGVLLDESKLAQQLTEFLAKSDQFHAREWALANISCHQSSKRMNEWLRDYAGQDGREWTVDIAPLCCRPNPLYVNPEDASRLRPAYAELQRDFGLRFEAFPVTE